MDYYKVSETYDVVTHESAEIGDYEESGFNFQDDLMTAREIADHMRDGGFTNPSSSVYHRFIWFSTDGDTDMFTGDVTTRQLHFTNNMPERLVRAICKVAGVRLG